MNHEITIRPSTKADLPEIAQLAALDSRHSPAGDALLAFVDHEAPCGGGPRLGRRRGRTRSITPPTSSSSSG